MEHLGQKVIQTCPLGLWGTVTFPHQTIHQFIKKIKKLWMNDNGNNNQFQS